MKKSILIKLIIACLLLPYALKAQQIVSLPVTDASTGATFTYNLVEDDVNALYRCYKQAKKEDGAVDIVAKEAFRTLLINHFVKKPKVTAERLRYVRLASVGLELAESLGGKKDDKSAKEGKLASAVTVLLQELLPKEEAGEVKN
jgi:hypothetical protein